MGVPSGRYNDAMKIAVGCILIAAVLGDTVFAAPALPVQGAGEVLPRVTPGEELRKPRLSPAQAAARARREHGGKVLDVRLERAGLRPYYRVKLLKDGNVRSVRIPAD